MTHDDLITLGLFWMSRSGYDIFDFETPQFTLSPFSADLTGIRFAYGEKSFSSPLSTAYNVTIIEAKITRNDWKSKSQKLKEQWSMQRMYANHHYLLCPAGLLKKDEIHPAWGLIVIPTDGYPRVIKRAKRIKLYDCFKTPLWQIVVGYAHFGMYSKLKILGINYYKKSIEPRGQNHISRLIKDIRNQDVVLAVESNRGR